MGLAHGMQSTKSSLVCLCSLLEDLDPFLDFDYILASEPSTSRERHRELSDWTTSPARYGRA